MRCLPLATLLFLGTTAIAAEKKEWAPGVPYTTDWKAAIKQAHNTGKILVIYNGWQREKI